MKRIEYAVCTDTFEISSSTLVGSKRIGKPFPRSFSVDELSDIYTSLDNPDENVACRFETKEEAIAEANKMPVSTRVGGFGVKVIDVDIVTVEEITIDDDGEEELTGMWLLRAMPYNHSKGTALISVDNGNTYCTVEEAIAQKDWDEIVNFMDDEVRETVHDEIAPCTNEEFLARYLELSDEDLIVG